MSRWQDDDAQQKRVRDLVIGPGFYGPYAVEGRYVVMDKGQLATLLQKRFAVDTVAQSRGGEAVFIEEKIVRWPGYAYTSLTLETRSCTVPGHESDGWMVYGQADYLLYAMCTADGNVLVHFIHFAKLKEAFWPAVGGFKSTVTEQHNRTECRIVPIDWIRAKVGVFSKLIYATPEGCEAVHAFNGTHYRNRPPPQQLGLFP
jgi:hypothetical protein